MRPARILIVDDEEEICRLLADNLSSEHQTVEWTTHPSEVLEKVKAAPYELVILDVRMPEISGMQLLPSLKKASPETAILVISGFGNIAVAVKAMKEGADDYLEKPFRDFDEIRMIAERLIKAARIRIENQLLRRQLEDKFQLDKLISASSLMQEVFALVKKIAPISATVLIAGETGTGKERIARTLHNLSSRANGPFVSVNCGGLPEGLLESLLFGHEKGAFTGAFRRTRGYFEEADGGILFLDEVGETPPALQVKLLRVLQERTFQRVGGNENISTDVRLVAATNKDLETEVNQGRFRQDLYYRLNVITVALPPLRERREDIPLLARYFVDKYTKAFKCKPLELTSEAIILLCQQPWPGNVRELENGIERAVALAEGPYITARAFDDDNLTQRQTFWEEFLSLPLKEARLLFEKRYLIDNLQRHRGNVTHAARSAGILRQNYHRKIKQLEISYSRDYADVLADET
ncbi:MAG: sigma-54 dependent transcriptional regulator [bacterium]